LSYFEAAFEGLPINLASLYIHTIGAGGGSVVWIDEGDHLQVGPMSAGADPGPAAYGKGGVEATFTDAALQVGYLGAAAALAGTLVLDASLAKNSLQKSADRLKMDVDDVANGVIRISVTKIVGAVRAITVELGHTPSDFALLSFGGGGGLVAVDVARELMIPTVIIPPGPGAFCAFGMLMASVQHDFSRTKISMFSEADPVQIESEFIEMQKSGSKTLLEEGFDSTHQTFQRYIDLRYLGQEHTVTMKVGPDMDAAAIDRISEEFAMAHEKAYGHAMPDPIEMVAVRLSAFGNVDQPKLPEISARTSGSLQPIGTRDVYQANGKRISYAIYHRDDFSKGDTFNGPAIVNEHTGTTVIHPGDSVTIGAHGEIVISLGKGK
jgi:N-methylhydantoinase A